MKRVKTGKRILSIVLALMMLVSLIPITAMADTGSTEKTWADTAEGEFVRAMSTASCKVNSIT